MAQRSQLRRQRQKIEIGEAGQSKLAVAVHDEVIAEGRVEAGDLSGVCADGLNTGALRNWRFVAFSIAAIMRGPSAAQICRYSSAAVANWGVCGVNSSDSARCRDNASNGTIKIAATSTQHFSMCTRTFSL